MPLIGTRGAASAQGFGEFAQQSSGVQANAIDFDGTNDELSRATDLVGNADGKTFTFSCWLWRGEIGSNQRIYYSLDSRYGLYIQPDTSNNLIIYGYNAANTQILNATVTVPFQVGFTFINILISIDMANTANRAVYINDVAATVTWTTYTNAAINFTCPTHKVGQALKGRLSNVFLDYTYRDLSVTANRRLFVTADLKPAAGQAALNPIMYLPMSDPTQPGLNQGTGGNFTLTGTVARSGRGPNQYNAPYSDLDGTADYLSRATDPTGLVDGNAFTLAFNINVDSVSTQQRIVYVAGGYFDVQIPASNTLSITGYTSALGDVINAQVSANFVVGRNYSVVMSFDTSNTSKRHVYINGVAASVTYSAYNNANIDWTRNNFRIGATSVPDNYVNGRLGALWFNTSYIDLSQPANLAKFVTGTGIDAKPVDLGASGELPTGTSPLIYLPMYGNNAGKNYGSGGDFTVNSGPYTGARGPNEFWGNAANFDGVTTFSKLTRTTGIGLSDGKTFSMSFWFKPNGNESGDFIFNIGNDAFGVRRDTSDKFNFYAGSVLDAASVSSIATDNIWYHALVCIDLSNTSKRFVYINGTAYTMTWTTYTNSNIGFSGAYYTIGGYWAGSYYNSAAFNGGISEFYFTTDYIDFSQEANRLKFRDAFGNPVDLTQQIEDGAIPNPAIYMRFPPTAFGTNYGTGGDFTVNGTITDGGQL